MANSLVSVLVFLFVQASSAATFTFTNNCGFSVWPGALSNAGHAALSSTGFALEPGQSRSLDAPAAWSGRFWGRTLCSADAAGGFSCGTGDCGSGKVDCSGGGATPPATLAEFTLGGGGDGTDYYDVSMVDGYNLALVVAPQGGRAAAGGGCVSAGCAVDLNAACPAELRVAVRAGGGVACRSACEAFGAAQYCCNGAYSNPDTCKPSSYSHFFKNACPKAYSYAFDDATSTFTCSAPGYLITFCPAASTTTSTQKSSGQSSNSTGTGGLPAGDGGTGGLPAGDGGTLVFLGGYDFGGAPAPACAAAIATILVAAFGVLWIL